MIKLVSAVLVLALISSGIYAQDIVHQQDKSPGFFVGVDYFSGETEINRDISSNESFERELDHSGFRLKFGVQSKRNIRVQGYIKIEDLEDEIPLLSSNGKIESTSFN